MAEPAPRFEVVTLANGAGAIRERASGEVMHPAVGPWEEARALYVEQTRLRARLLRDDPSPVRIWDVGLGGAANAVAALECHALLGSEARRRIEIVSFERDTEPLELALANVGRFPFLSSWGEAARALLDDGRWERAGARWTLLRGDALERARDAEGPPELVFHDPFSPEANPALWTVDALFTIRERAQEGGPGTVLVTYSASTRTRVSLLLAGWFVGVGVPIGTKRETTIAASRLDLLAHPLNPRWLERWKRSTSRAPWGEDLTPELEARVGGHAQFS